MENLLDLSLRSDWPERLTRLAALPKPVAKPWPVIHLHQILARPTRLQDRIAPTAAARLVAFKHAVEAALPGMVAAMILFGSRARGDALADSDYDVAAVLRGQLARDPAVQRLIGDVAWDQFSDGMEVQTVELNLEDFQPALTEIATRIAMDGIPVR